MKYLHLRFYGGMRSFGAPAVGKIRSTDIFPAASMITGLLANALGYDRVSDKNKIQLLQDSISMGTRIDVPSDRFVDYQIARIEKGEEKLIRYDGYPEGKVYDGGVIQYKHYLTNGTTHVVIGLPNNDPEEIAHAINFPARTLFVGRACCVPTEPLFQGFIDADSAYGALCKIPMSEEGAKQAEWPVGTREPEGKLKMEKHDVRDWSNDVHSGSRWVWRGLIGGEAI